jgi:bifunctional non-homologous end joining protein LigD
MAQRALSTYRRKRDFSKTAEPSGKSKVAPSDRLRFVIQKHAASHLHYDLRLELDGVFKSWAVTKGPSVDPAQKRLAVEVEDHPLDYGDFEGTIPKGQYGGGTVQLWDRGFWQPEGNKTPQEAMKSGDLKFTLDGERLHGSWVLVRMKQDRFGNKRTNWLLIKHKDQAAVAGGAEALLSLDSSVASGRSMQQIASGRGKAPKPFMLASGSLARPNAVWNSHGEDAGDAAVVPAAASSASTLSRTKPVLVEAIPRFIEPQLCKLVTQPPAVAGWAHEVKFDGYRAQIRVNHGTASIHTRRGLDWSKQFAAIVKDARVLPDCLIDGEIVALDHKRLPSFSALQRALSEGASESLIYFAFDLLFKGLEDIRGKALSDRKALLRQFLDAASPGERLRYVQHLESRADTVLESACKMGLEGIISKRLDAPYVSGRSSYWTKAKCRAGQEVVLGGWSTQAGQFRSLLAGVYRKGLLVYIGRIGTGYGQKVVAELLPQLKALTRETSPFGGASAPLNEQGIRWLKPTLVAEIEFAGWTGTGMIRQASFKALRADKPASEVFAEMPEATPENDLTDAEFRAPAMRTSPPARASTKSKAAKTSSSRAPAAKVQPITRQRGPSMVMGVSISKPDKALWPDAGDGTPVTKLDLAQYYQKIGPWLLPHIAGRPSSLVRVPDGLGGQQFFQRHAMAGMSNLIAQIKVRGDKAPYVQIDRLEALAALAQMGALEIHPWNCAPGNPEVAGRLVFDLDPAPGLDFAAVVAGALEIHARLKKLGLESFCKTTGGKGLHVVAPLLVGKKAVKWPIAKNFAHIVCAQMAQDSPNKYLDNMAKSQRTGKIFLDYLRNDRTATAVAVLSPRARAGAPVSMPIDWPAVRSGLDPTRYNVRTVPELLQRSKPWQSYDEASGSLVDAIRMMTGSAAIRRSSR